jgi:hypothetical protein
MTSSPPTPGEGGKLTKAQRALLVRAAASGDCYVWGRHQMRTANVLHERGLIARTVNGYATITEAGRAALKEQKP